MRYYWLLELKVPGGGPVFLFIDRGVMGFSPSISLALRFKSENDALLYLADLRKLNAVHAEIVDLVEPKEHGFDEGEPWITKLSQFLRRAFSSCARPAIGT